MALLGSSRDLETLSYLFRVKAKWKPERVVAELMRIREEAQEEQQP
jgi:hypothetical protein